MRNRSSNKTAFSAKCHVVFCPKYRRGALGEAAPEWLKVLVREVRGQVADEVLGVETSTAAERTLTAAVTNQGHVVGWSGRRSGFCSGPTIKRSSSTDLVAAAATMRKPTQPGHSKLSVHGSTGPKEATARARSGFA